MVAPSRAERRWADVARHPVARRSERAGAMTSLKRTAIIVALGLLVLALDYWATH